MTETVKLSDIRRYVHARHVYQLTLDAGGRGDILRLPSFLMVREGDRLFRKLERQSVYVPNSGEYRALHTFQHISTMAGMLAKCGPHYPRLREKEATA